VTAGVLPDTLEFVRLALVVLSPIVVFAILAAAMPSVRHLWNAPVATSVAISLLAILVYPIGAASSTIARLIVGDLREFTHSDAFRQALRRQQVIEQGLTWSLSWLLLFGVTYFVGTLSSRSISRQPLVDDSHAAGESRGSRTRS